MQNLWFIIILTPRLGNLGRAFPSTWVVASVWKEKCHYSVDLKHWTLPGGRDRQMARESLRSACFSQLTISCCSRLVDSTFCKWNVDDSVEINSVGNAPSTPIKLKTIAARQLSQCGNCFNFEWWFSLDCRIYNQYLVKHFPSRWQNKFPVKEKTSKHF